jgi:hypothetical protein
MLTTALLLSFMAQISATSMRLVDLLHFVAEHEEHHLAQIGGRCNQKVLPKWLQLRLDRTSPFAVGDADVPS